MRRIGLLRWTYFRKEHRKKDKKISAHELLNTKPDSSALAAISQAISEGTIDFSSGAHSIKETLLQLQQARDHYREVYDFSPVGFATFTRLGNFLDLNLALANMLGRERERIKGLSFSCWLVKGQLKYFIRHLNAVFLTRQKQTVELSFHDDAHQTKTIRMETVVAMSPSGAPTTCNSVIFDVAQNKKVDVARITSFQALERQLLDKTHQLQLTLNELSQQINAHRITQSMVNESEERYRLLFSSVDDALILYDMETQKIVDANDSAVDIYGYSLDELKSLNFGDLRFAATVEDVLGCKGSACSTSLRPPLAWHKSKVGTPFPVELSAGSFIWKGREVVFAFVRNMRDKLIVESRLNLAAEVFECANEAIMVTDHEYKIVMINQAFTKTTGYEVEEVLGKDSRLLLSHCPDFESLSRAGSPSNDRSRYSRENLHRHKSGVMYYAWENFSAVRNADGIIAYHVWVFSDISPIKSEERKSIYLAHHDALTSLPNRLLFNARLEQSLQLAKRHQTHLALLFLDLDRFKFINDSMGHACGDVLLREIALRILNCVREQDTVARLGGDEFVVLLSEIHHEQEAALLAEKILRAINQPISLERRSVTVSASIGISLFPRDANNAAELLKSSDIAMYSAKEKGCQKYEFYTSELTAKAEERLQLEHEIRENLASGGFFLCYQPQFDLASGRMIGVEALLRWQHGSGVVYCPEKIIAIAEESSLILDLDTWVLRAACEQAAYWHRTGMPPLKVAINFSAMNLVRDNFAAKVQHILEEFALPPDWIELEVAERVLNSSPRVIEALGNLKTLGVTLAIDDFGKGNSSLSTLKKLPIDRIKIDRSFIADVPESRRDAGITEAIITMGHNLNLKITAAGVERDSQLHFLRSIGCDDAQGFRCAAPAVASSIPSYVDKGLTTHNVQARLEFA